MPAYTLLHWTNLPQVSAARPRVRTVRSMFMRDDFREYFHRQAVTLHMQVGVCTYLCLHVRAHVHVHGVSVYIYVHATYPR